MQQPVGAVEATRDWVRRTVIGLNLCPFAKAVEQRGRVRYRLSAATQTAELLVDLEDELKSLQAVSPTLIDTSLLIHPHVLERFLDYNDFLSEADALLGRLGLEGELQIASFHPEYRFAGSAADDLANYTNRSPYPMLQLLREASVARAVDSYPDPSRIYERNIETLRRLEDRALQRMFDDAKPRPR